MDCEACCKALAPREAMANLLQPRFSAVIVAAGKGLRAGQPLPKQFTRWRGKPLVRHSAEALIAAGATSTIVAIPEAYVGEAAEALGGLPNLSLVHGGATRQESVRAALEALPNDTHFVLIHDAARPDVLVPVIDRLLEALERSPAAIPVLPMVDSLAIAEGGRMTGNADREALRRVQTPQAFRFTDIREAHRSWSGPFTAGDDAQVARAAGLEIAIVEGDERMRKLTFAEDFMTPALPRIGIGFDVHRLAEGEELWLGGVHIEHDRGLAGHSDADVVLHAVVDALLGACGCGDIGQHFPPSDPQWRGAPSSRFVEHAVTLAREAGYAIGNVDVTVICEAPRLGPHRAEMRARLAGLLNVQIGAVNVKATTTEKLGFTGRGEGIASEAVAMLIPIERT